MTANILNGAEGTDTTEVSDVSKLDKVKTAASTAGLYAASAKDTTVAAVKKVATSDTVRSAGSKVKTAGTAVVNTAKDPEQRQLAVTKVRKHRNKGLVAAGVIVVVLVARKLRRKG